VTINLASSGAHRRRTPAADRAKSRLERRGSLVAIAVAALVAVLLGATVVVGAAAGDLSATGNDAELAISLASVCIGVLVARRQPGNAIGWIVLATALAIGLSALANFYSVHDLRDLGGAWPLGRASLFVANTFWALPIVVVGPTLLLFPDGRPPSRRWGLTLRAYVVLATLALASQGAAANFLASVPHLHFDAGGNITNHIVASPLMSFFGSGLPILVPAPFWLAWVVALVASYRRASGDRRQQLKWFAAGAAVTVSALIVNVALAAVDSGSGASTAARVVNDVSSYAVLALPIGLGLGILKYRLYDIDRLISRTISYALVTAALVGVYAGTVLLATRVLPFSSPVGVAASVLVAAALFNPLRRRVQHRVDRRFNRARYDAELTVARFATRLRDSIDPQSVHAELHEVVRAAFEPERLEIWLPGRRTDSTR
jgi:hypothetical protein